VADFISGTVLTAANLDAAFNQVIVNAQTGTSYSLLASDQGGMVTMNNGSANTLTVPPNVSVALPVGTTILVASIGAGQTTVAAGAGVTVNGTPGLKIRTRYSAATLVQLSANNWIIIGDLSA
jgi:hypothetical protein